MVVPMGLGLKNGESRRVVDINEPLPSAVKGHNLLINDSSCGEKDQLNDA